MSSNMDVDSPSASAGPSSAAAPPSDPTLQLPINLFTRDPTHAIPQSTYLIPAGWRRFQLSELINKVLSAQNDGGPPVPFDFVVEGELLRTTLESWVHARRGGDVESTINVEYIRSVLPPKQVESWPQDDWVSGVSLGMPGHILLSSYLSHLKILPLTQASQSQPTTLPLPTSLGATCCAWLSPAGTTSDVLLGAGSLDRLGHVFRLPSLEAGASSTPEEILTLHGHSGPISSIAPSRDFAHVLTSSWDTTLNLYALPTSASPLESMMQHEVAAEPVSYLPGQNRAKKRRVAPGANGTADAAASAEATAQGEGSAGWRRAPLVTLRGHTARIGGAVWDRSVSGRAWSAGWDGSVRGWDAESGVGAEIKQGPGERAGLCIDQWERNGTLVTGNMDRTICLWDTREATSIISLTIGTTSPVPSVRAHPTSTYTLASATYSGLLQIWDVRSPKQALFSVARQPKDGKGERVLCLDWDGERMVAGGEDGEVGLWTARGQ